MAVISTSGYHYICAETKSFSPFRTKCAYRLVCCLGSLEKSFTESGKKRIQLHKELFRRKPPPALVPHCLMSFRTTAADYILGLGHTCEHRRKPLAIFHDRICLCRHFRSLTKHMDGLCPEPLGRIYTSLILRVVDVVLLTFDIDFCSLLYSRMILPEDEHRIRILLEFREHCKRCSGLIGESRSRASGIESDSDHIGSDLRGTFSQCLLYACLQYFQIVFRMLTPLIGFRDTVKSLHPAWIIFHGRSQNLAGECIHDKSTCRVCSVIQSYNIFTHNLIS